MTPALETMLDEVAAICRRFGVRRLEVFGSAAAGRFDEKSSDIDLLVEFEKHPEPDLFPRYFGLREALSAALQRKVDLVMIGALRNPYFIESVNRTRRLVYASPLTEAA